jgi:hypothetical protein
MSMNLNWLDKMPPDARTQTPQAAALSEESRLGDLIRSFLEPGKEDSILDIGGVELKNDKVIIHVSPYSADALGNIKIFLTSLGIDEYTLKRDILLTTQYDSVVLDKKDLDAALQENITLSEVIRGKLVNLIMNKTDYFDLLTGDEQESGKLKSGKNIVRVGYNPIRSSLYLYPPPVLDSERDSQVLEDTLREALGEEVAETLQSQRNGGPFRTRFSVDTDKLLKLLKLNPDRVDYSKSDRKR